MEVLKQLFNDKEIELLYEDNEDIKKISQDRIKKVLSILSNQKCSSFVIRNIIGRYPDVLLRNPDDLEDLIYKFKEYNIIHLNKVFDKYPYILKKEAYEVDTYFFIKRKEGLDIEEIAKELEKDPKKIDMTKI